MIRKSDPDDLVEGVLFIMIGIYKIVSPTGKIYIGQTLNIAKRKNNYKNKKCKGQRFLYNSILKYGFENHTFDVIEECEIQNLNEKERYWQDFYNVLELGLNLKLTTSENKVGYLSNETKEKMSNTLKGRIITKEWRENLSKAGKGRAFTDSHREALKIANTSRKYSIETRKKISINNPTTKIVLDINTGVYYNSVIDLANTLKVNSSTLYDKLTGRKGYKNNTNYKIV